MDRQERALYMIPLYIINTFTFSFTKMPVIMSCVFPNRWPENSWCWVWSRTILNKVIGDLPAYTKKCAVIKSRQKNVQMRKHWYQQQRNTKAHRRVNSPHPLPHHIQPNPASLRHLDTIVDLTFIYVVSIYATCGLCLDWTIVEYQR